MLELQRAGKLGVNLRPPLIYGPHARGNWQKLIRLAQLPVPLPFGSVRNRRSYLDVASLSRAVIQFLHHHEDSEKSGTYEIADATQVSLREVVTAIRSGLGKPAGLLPFPPGLMRRVLQLGGKPDMADGLMGDLDVDPRGFADAFAWTPEADSLKQMEVAAAGGKHGSSLESHVAD